MECSGLNQDASTEAPTHSPDRLLLQRMRRGFRSIVFPPSLNGIYVIRPSQPRCSDATWSHRSEKCSERGECCRAGRTQAGLKCSYHPRSRFLASVSTPSGSGPAPISDSYSQLAPCSFWRLCALGQITGMRPKYAAHMLNVDPDATRTPAVLSASKSAKLLPQHTLSQFGNSSRGLSSSSSPSEKIATRTPESIATLRDRTIPTNQWIGCRMLKLESPNGDNAPSLGIKSPRRTWTQMARDSS